MMLHCLPAFSPACGSAATAAAVLAPNPARAVRRRVSALAALTAFLLGGAALYGPGARAQASQPQLDLPRTRISAGMHQIDAQVAQTPTQRQIGLMHRREMPQHEGMLFIFEEPAVQCFWMKNTLLPLTAAFVADDGSIVNLADMKPLSEDSHCSKKPVRFVLEMNQGWFAKRNVQAGYKLGGEVFRPR